MTIKEAEEKIREITGKEVTVQKVEQVKNPFTGYFSFYSAAYAGVTDSVIATGNSIDDLIDETIEKIPLEVLCDIPLLYIWKNYRAYIVELTYPETGAVTRYECADKDTCIELKYDVLEQFCKVFSSAETMCKCTGMTFLETIPGFGPMD